MTHGVVASIFFWLPFLKHAIAWMGGFPAGALWQTCMHQFLYVMSMRLAGKESIEQQRGIRVQPLFSHCRLNFRLESLLRAVVHEQYPSKPS